MGQNSRGGASTEVVLEGGREPLFAFNDKETYYPLFCLTETPDEYFDALNSNRPPDTSWLAISSSAPSLPQLLREIQSHLDEPPSKPTPIPFLGSTIPQIYSFFKAHLRRTENSKSHHHFTHFTFLVVDTECFQPPSPSTESPTISPSPQHSNYTILLCSDAPDFHESETEVRLKTLRLPLAHALGSLNSVEYLLMTPSEIQQSDFQDSDTQVVKLIPPPTFIPVEPFTNDEDQEYRVATPAEARSKKREGIMAAVAAGWELGRGWKDDPGRTVTI